MLTAAARPRRRLVTSSTESHSLNYCDYYTVFNFYCRPLSLTLSLERLSAELLISLTC